MNFYRILKNSLVIFSVLFVQNIVAQNSFYIPDNLKKNKINFKLVNNLIVIPVVVNGVELSFILDTGVGSTIIFSLEDRNTLELRNATKIFLRGLGNDAPLEAVKSLHNTVKIGNATSKDHTIYLVPDQGISFSSRMGLAIHGIIGYDFFKDFLIELNYTRKTIKAYKSNLKNQRNCRKCYETELGFFDKKRPYVSVNHLTKNGLVKLKLLIDSGSGSSLWLFQNDNLGLTIPKNSFYDYLGRGFSGDIYGYKTKIDNILIGDFKLKDVTTSFPDSIYLKEISIKDRQGSIGSGILKRFNIIFDYKNKKIRFKKNSNYDKSFHYNMSGLTIEHIGTEIGETSKKNRNFGYSKVAIKNEIARTSLSSSTKGYFELVLIPKYEIYAVRPDSPAFKAGLKKGDVLVKINSKKSEEYTLSEINDLFYSEEGKKIKLTIDRGGVVMTFTFFLEKVI